MEEDQPLVYFLLQEVVYTNHHYVMLMVMFLNGSLGIRPIVTLKSDVTINTDGKNGTTQAQAYEIK
jgi:hypothetical protein